MKNRLTIVLLVALMALPTKAQTFGLMEQPAIQFRSTSSMAGSGSAYSSNPMLNADGTATYESSSSSPARASGPRRIGPAPSEKPDEKDLVPVGDDLIPLILMVMAYATYLLLRRRRRA